MPNEEEMLNPERWRIALPFCWLTNRDARSSLLFAACLTGLRNSAFRRPVSPEKLAKKNMTARHWSCRLSILIGAIAMYGTSASGADLQACRLSDMRILGDVGLGFPRIPYRLRTVGEVRFKVLFVDFPDVPATSKPGEVMAVISPAVEKFFDAVSYGKLKTVFDVEDHWIRMHRSSVDYHFGRGAAFDVQRQYMQEAIDLDSVPAGDADAVLVITNPHADAIDWGPAFSALPGNGLHVGTRILLNGATSGSDLPVLGWTWFAHEIGHTMSLIDLAGPLPENGLWHTYVGDFSAMGNPLGTAPEYLGWERWQLGWLNDTQVVCVQEDSVVSLTPIERIGGTKLVVVPTGKTTAVVVESRRPEGFDRKLARSGPLVYTVDTALTTHQGAIRVLPQAPNDELHWHSLLIKGQAVHSGDVEITLISTGAGGDQVRIRRFTSPPTLSDPTSKKPPSLH